MRPYVWLAGLAIAVGLTATAPRAQSQGKNPSLAAEVRRRVERRLRGASESDTGLELIGKRDLDGDGR